MFESSASFKIELMCHIFGMRVCLINFIILIGIFIEIIYRKLGEINENMRDVNSKSAYM